MQENFYNDDERLYLQMMQEDINRMAMNSANTKTWLVTLVAAILAIGCSMEDVHYWLLLALVPILALWYLDAYYLKLEREFRNREQNYINLKRTGASSRELNDALYDFSPLPKKTDDAKNNFVETKCQLFKKAVCPIYFIMCLAIIIVTGSANGWLKVIISLFAGNSQ